MFRKSVHEYESIDAKNKNNKLIVEINSFARNPVESISKKIRHFYDLHYLMNDVDCAAFVKSDDFKKKFNEILAHDKELFDDPEGWREKTIAESILITDFDNILKQLKAIYKTELSALAYAAIPNEEDIAKSFTELIKLIF